MTKLVNDTISSGKHISYWLYSEMIMPEFGMLKEDLETDVVIVGAGIAGLSVAYCLVQSGKRVVVIEDGFIGSGETGRTTAHLVTALDDRYYELERLFGAENLVLIAGSHKEAIDFVENTVRQENIECDFSRVSGYLFLHPSDKPGSLTHELEAARKAGLDVAMLDNIPGIKNESGPCIEFKNQAQFHPLKYVKGLCKAISAKGAQLYTQTHAEEITSDGIVTPDGFKVKAAHIVVATNAPVNSRFILPIKQFAMRTYVIAAEVKKNSIPQALWWDTGDFEMNANMPPYHYVRVQAMNETHDLLIVGGEDHATGLADAEDMAEEERYARLETWMRGHFEAEDIIYRWSGQVMEPVDSMAYIGKSPMDKSNILIASGDSGNGMTHGTLAGLIISDIINGRKNPYEDIYDPGRLKFKSIGPLFKEFTSGFVAYLKNKSTEKEANIDKLPKDEGRIYDWRGKKCGVYRDTEDYLHIVSAECTHLQCIIKWNNDEKTWDCPCHGSRFTPQGVVLNGPANTPLDHHTEKLESDY